MNFGGSVLASCPPKDRQQQVHRQQFQLPARKNKACLNGEDGDLAAIHRQDQKKNRPRLKVRQAQHRQAVVKL